MRAPELRPQRRMRGQLAATQARKLERSAVAAAAKGLGLSGKRQQVYETILFHLADSRNPNQDLSLTQIHRLCLEEAEISQATVRRTMAALVESGQAKVKVAGSRGKGLETVWVVDRVSALAEAYPTALKLTREGRLPGHQKASRNRELARAAVAQWEGLTGRKPALLRGQKFQTETLLGGFPSSFQSSGIPDHTHSIPEAHPRAEGEAGMAAKPQAEKDKGGVLDPVAQDALRLVTQALVTHLGADPRGAALPRIEPQTLKQLVELAPALRDGISQLAPEHVPELAQEVGGAAQVNQPLPFLIATLRSNPTRVHRGLERFLKRLAARIEARNTALAQAGYSAVEASKLPRAVQPAFAAWALAKGQLPLPETAGFLEAFDREREAFGALVRAAEDGLPPERREDLARDLRQRLHATGLHEDGLVWRRAWAHHWGAAVAEASGFAHLLEP